MGQCIAEFDWCSHPLGTPQTWPPSLKTAISLILNSRHPMWIGWGREMWFLYNDAYLHVLGIAKHPWALGRPAPQVWSEIWDVCGPLADKVFQNGEASFVDDVRLFMSRGDFLEETYYSFSYSPIRNESGGVDGLFCPSNDVSAKVIGARRLQTLSEVAENALAEKSASAACASAAATLAKNPDDVPFALLYLADGDRCVLEQSIGVGEGVLRPAVVPLSGSGESALWPIGGVFQTGLPQRVSIDSVRPLPLGAANMPVTEALVLPVAPRAEQRPLGALVVGLNPTGKLDHDYRAFCDLLASNIGTAIRNARAAEDEKRRADLLAEMDRAKTLFFSNVSHEFRTPLTLMLGPLEQLAHVEDPRYTPLVETARRNALRLLKLVNTLLEFSRLEAGRSDASFVQTDLAEFTRDVASSFRSAFESAGLKFSIETDLDEPVFVDRSMWERIVLNLLSNALKYTLAGKVAITLRSVDGSAELSVRDTGAGIAEDELPHLFERFHRVRGAKARSFEGSGIGLALVRDLVTLHGGSVSAESAVGVGTTFRVRIPLGSAHLDPAQIASIDTAPYASSVQQYLADTDAALGRVRAAAADAPAIAGNRERILLADDNADLRDYVSRILAPRYDVVAVANGREALLAARSGKFDLIISDVMMPDVDGFELLAAVRADERLSSTPFVMLSARAGEEAAFEGLVEGADEYIVKPFSAEELLVRVYAQINAASLRRRATEDLRASEQRFRTLASSLPYIVFESDAKGSVTFLSDEYTTYTGLPFESGYGSNYRHVLHPDDVEAALDGWAQAVASGEPLSTEFRLRRHDGAYRWFAARAIPQRDAGGSIVRWTGTVTDVHDQRRAMQERELLAEASQILAQSLDLDSLLKAIAWFTVPHFADWCQIDLRMDDGRIKTVAMAHRDPEKDAIAQQFVGRIHLNPEGMHGSPYVIRTGRSQFIPDVSPDIVNAAVGDPEETRMYRELGIQSAAAVPLVAEGHTFGMLGVLYGESKRRYTEDDMPMLEELGRRAGLAIQKARLFEREHRAAGSFQEASLPAQLPQVPGLQLDAFYAPGRTEAQVGGDWYDAVRLLDGRVVVSIGDVAGSGLQAAVTMGNMRQIIRGIAQVHADPTLMLNAADRALRLEHPDKFVTAFVGVFDLVAETLTYASAGHPPALLRHPDGRVESLPDSGLPLGLRTNGTNTRSTTVDLSDGSSLLLYTDGLTEFDRAPASGERNLKAAFAQADIHEASHPAKAIVERVLKGAVAHDDVAVLVANVVAAAERDADGHELLQRWVFDTADEEAAGAARRNFARSLQVRGAAYEDVAAAELVFGELVGNTVRYAPGRVSVVADWSGSEPVLHVCDNGPGFRHIAILPPDILSESGRGLFIVSSLTHDFRVSKRREGGSHARAVLRLQSRQLADRDHPELFGALIHALTDRTGLIPD